MSLADRLAQQLSEKNPEFKDVWEDPERQQQFDLSCRLVELRRELDMTQQQLADNNPMSLGSKMARSISPWKNCTKSLIV
jgi:hypothetical protein